MSTVKRISDFETHMGNGRRLIHAGHPTYCALDHGHEPHQFDYSFVDGSGALVTGNYFCQGDPMVYAERPNEAWHDAGVEVDYRWHQFTNAKDPLSQARALTDLANAMSDLRTFLPGYDFETGMAQWERELD